VARVASRVVFVVTVATLATLLTVALAWLTESPAHAATVATHSATAARVHAAATVDVLSAPTALLTPARPSSLVSRPVTEPRESKLPPEPATPAELLLQRRAPLCDVRGATTFASAPQMQDTEATLDVDLAAAAAAAADACRHATSGARGGAGARAAGSSREAGPPRDPSPPAASSSLPPVTTTGGTHVARSPSVSLSPPRASRDGERRGVRSTVDRPPRT